MRTKGRRLVNFGRLGFLALTVVWLSLPITAQSQVNGLSIPSGHPRIWWTPERISRAQQWYAANPFNPGTPGPNNEHRSLENAFVSIVTGNQSYCRAAIDWAMTVMIPQGQLDGVSSDDARWYGEYVVLTFDWCYSALTASEKSTLISRWNGFLDAIRVKEWGGPTMPQSNYFWGYLRNELLWGIATYGENSMAQTFLDFALTTRWQNAFVPHANTTGVGGIAHEGSNYGAALYDYSTIALRSTALLGRDLLDETGYFSEAVYALIYSSPPGRSYSANGTSPTWQLFPFADDGRFREGNFLASNHSYSDYMQMAAEFWGNDALGAYARRWLRVVGNSSRSYIRAVDLGQIERSFSTLPFDYYAAGAAQLYGRTSWNGSGTAVHFQLGQTIDDGHQHADKGNFQIWRNGRWLTREAVGYVDSIIGYGNRSATSQSPEAHNTLLINGQGVAQWPTTQATVRRLESTPDYLYADTDLTSLYRSGAHVEREFLFIRPWETLLILDRIETSSSATRTFLEHFEHAPSLQAQGRVLAVNGDQALSMVTLYPANPVRRVVDEGGSTGLQRLEVEATASGVGYFLNLLQARDSSGQDIAATITESATSFQLSLTHPSLGTAEVRFEKGASSSGGSIALNGSSAAFLPRVQGFQVTSTGPLWEGSSGTIAVPDAPTNLSVQ